MKDIYCVYGTGGFGREVMPLLEEQLALTGKFEKS
jgi:hypothetical protein